MSARMMPAVWRAMSSPVWNRFCNRMRATDSGLIASQVPFLLSTSLANAAVWSW